MFFGVIEMFYKQMYNLWVYIVSPWKLGKDSIQLKRNTCQTPIMYGLLCSLVEEKKKRLALYWNTFQSSEGENLHTHVSCEMDIMRVFWEALG